MIDDRQGTPDVQTTRIGKSSRDMINTLAKKEFARLLGKESQNFQGTTVTNLNCTLDLLMDERGLRKL